MDSSLVSTAYPRTNNIISNNNIIKIDDELEEVSKRPNEPRLIPTFLASSGPTTTHITTPIKITSTIPSSTGAPTFFMTPTAPKPTPPPIVETHDWDKPEPPPKPICKDCGGDQFEEDHAQGDLTCVNCGLILSERIVSEEAEYRVFADDSASKSKVRVGAAYNPFMEYSLTENSKLERDEKEFLWDGLRNIEEIWGKLTKGDSVNKPVQERAKELFQKAFHLQLQQKKGTVPMKRSGGAESVKFKNRQKFSRRKQFVVSCLYLALKEQNINTWTTEQLSEQLDGIAVSKFSVRNCLKDLGINIDE